MDPADLADDATGRVEIFTLDVAQVDGHARGAALRDDHGQPAAARPSAVVSLAEGIEGRVALAALLVTCLVLGLLLTR